MLPDWNHWRKSMVTASGVMDSGVAPWADASVGPVAVSPAAARPDPAKAYAWRRERRPWAKNLAMRSKCVAFMVISLS
jgi:hypothetical protein